jgi:hypothetical protein
VEYQVEGSFVVLMWALLLRCATSQVTVFLGEYPGLCMRSMHAVPTQCTRSAHAVQQLGLRNVGTFFQMWVWVCGRHPRCRIAYLRWFVHHCAYPVCNTEQIAGAHTLRRQRVSKNVQTFVSMPQSQWSPVMLPAGCQAVSACQAGFLG